MHESLLRRSWPETEPEAHPFFGLPSGVGPELNSSNQVEGGGSIASMISSGVLSRSNTSNGLGGFTDVLAFIVGVAAVSAGAAATMASGGLDKLPTQMMGNKTPGQADMDRAERDMRRMEGIICSMTPLERRKPDLLKATRKRRVAAGAGVHVQEVNRLLNQFEQMRDMMKKMKGGGMMKMMKRMGAMKGMGGPGGLR